jgi:hypothetical protein
MLEFQRADDVSFDDWKELQSSYKTLYGKEWSK